MNVLEKIKKRAKRYHKKIVFPEGDDSRVRKAAKIISKEKIAEIILLKKGGMEKRLIDGIEMVKRNEADALVSGASHSSVHTLRVAFRYIGIKKGVKKSSGAFLMVLENRVLMMADCAAIPDPDARELVEIARLSAENFEMLTGKKAKIAMLSYSTKGSGKGESVEKVKKAIRVAKSLGLNVDGELQVDAALDREVCKKKCPNCKFKGNANVLIFPNLDAANIGYKLIERLGKAKAVGVILQGLKKPINDFSRGCSVEDIVNLAAITVLQSLK